MFGSEDLRPVECQWSWRADNPVPADDVLFNCRKIFLILIIKISSMELYNLQGGFLTAPPNFEYQNEKWWAANQIFCAMKFLMYKNPRKCNNVFLFSTEIWAEQLKNTLLMLDDEDHLELHQGVLESGI